MRAGRPKGFDEQEALERATDVFWERGYQGAGMADLLREMGISRQSLYDTFGNKRALFLRVLDHYRSTQLAEALAMLERDGSPIGNVKAVLGFFEALGGDPAGRGCLVANSLVEFAAVGDEEIASELRDTLGLLRQRIAIALQRAQAQGELDAGKSPDQLSRALTNAIIGIAVTGRLQIDRGNLADVCAGTLSMLE